MHDDITITASVGNTFYFSTIGGLRHKAAINFRKIRYMNSEYETFGWWSDEIDFTKMSGHSWIIHNKALKMEDHIDDLIEYGKWYVA